MKIKDRVKRTVASILFASGLTQPRRRSAGRLTIVTFHRVLPDTERRAYPYPGLVVTPEDLDALLRYFTRHFDCGTLARQHSRFADGQSPSRPLLAVTFDDGQHDNFLHARPVLARHGVHATFFIPVRAVEQRELLWHDQLGFALDASMKGEIAERQRVLAILEDAGIPRIRAAGGIDEVAQATKVFSAQARLDLIARLKASAGRNHEPAFSRLMTCDEIVQLAREGHEIGSHSMTHRMMPECDDGALQYELVESRRALLSAGVPRVESFCYPNGDCDDRSAQAVKRAGYLRAVTTRWGDNARDADPFRLRRFDINVEGLAGNEGRPAPEVLAMKMSGFYRIGS